MTDWENSYLRVHLSQIETLGSGIVP
jgi:hypothetical protein